jgi:aryl-alcohol dehydrogenase-like predicted oxidoreductase
LATKAAVRGPMTWLRDGAEQVDQSPAQLRQALEKSLKRLRTDYIDVYQLHWPDRPVALFGAGGLVYRDQGGEHTPMLEILETLGAFVKEGKVRWIGVSNETAWGVMRFLHHAEARGLPRMQSIQNAYHLLNRTFEIGLAEIAHRENVGLLAYSPLAQGYLSGKYRNGALPPKSRKALFNRLQRYEKPQTAPALERYAGIAERFGLDLAQMAIKFCATRDFVTSTIIGATTMEQLKTDIGALACPWPPELEQAVTDAHHAQPNPAP